ncbi:MAG: 4Fe-4S binding protein [Pseudomonadota bacterium]
MSREEEIKLLRAKAEAIKARLAELERLPAGALRAVVDRELCQGCGLCAEVCLEEAMALNSTAEVDPERCLGCGLCVQVCPEGAISLVRT